LNTACLPPKFEATIILAHTGKDLYGMIDDKVLKNLEKAGQNLTIECFEEFLKLLSALSANDLNKENEERILNHSKRFVEECTSLY